VKRDTLGISQGAASIVALAATAIIVAIALSAQLPNLYFVQAAGSQEAGKAEKLAGVRLSLVAVLEDGTAIIANDGPDPVTIDKLYTPSGVVSLTPPITVQPGLKISINLGSQPDALAAGLPDGRKVVLKEKPGVQVATLTTSVNPTSSTRITTSYRTTTTTVTTTMTTTMTPTYTQRTTIYSTVYTPFTVVLTQTSLKTAWVYTTTVTTEWWTWCNSPCYNTYVYTYSPTYTYTPKSGILIQTTSTVTATATARVGTTTTVSTDTVNVPPTVWLITSVVTTLPSVTTTTTTTFTTITLSTYYGTYYFTVTNYYSYYTSRPVGTATVTTTSTATATVTSTTVTTTTVS
jgi:hypothetical protein